MSPEDRAVEAYPGPFVVVGPNGEHHATGSTFSQVVDTIAEHYRETGEVLMTRRPPGGGSELAVCTECEWVQRCGWSSDDLAVERFHRHNGSVHRIDAASGAVLRR